MVEDSLIFDEKFWKVLKFIDKMREPTPLLIVVQESEVSRDEFQDVIFFLTRFNYKVDVKRVDGIEVVIPPDPKHRVQFDLSFGEWLALQSHFPKMQECSEEAYHDVLAEKLAEVEIQNSEYDLFKILEEDKRKQVVLQSFQNSEYGEVLSLIEKGLSEQKVLSISIKENQFFEFFPKKLVFLDGGLSVVGEECNDRCLVYFKVQEIKEASIESDHQYKTNFSPVEINDFIFAIRAVAGKEERLVLKITSAAGIDLKPPYHFLGNPYITSSPEGDLIWAASVEMSDELFEWLYEIRHHIEILDPTSVEDEYHKYCEERDKRVA